MCKEYQITFIDTEEVGTKYNQSEINFYISSKGHNALANYILDSMYQNKIESNHQDLPLIQHKFIENRSYEGVITSLSHDYEQSCQYAETLQGYSRARELAIAEEHKREMEIFEKVYQKRR